MFPFLKGKSAGHKRSYIDTSEAYNVWDILKGAYAAHERAAVWQNFAHDTDLKYVLERFSQSLNKHIKTLEQLAQKYGVKGPDSHITDVRTSVNSELVRDQYIGANMIIYSQESIEMVFQGIRKCTTNDHIRKTLINMAHEVSDRTDDLFRYVKLKGWIGTPPLYPHTPKDSSEKISCAEAFHIWDLLTYRYDNIRQTQIWYAFANDGDFKLLLEKGLQGTLKKQAKMLEAETKKFGIPLPIHPPEVLPTAENTELLEDDSMYRNLLMGVQGAAMMHIVALKQSIVNDRIRKMFKQLLFEEFDVLDKLVMYGKSKGWLNPTPNYSSIK
ncbi:MAG: DUF3231 family protein [Firmicutes bacterium]|nr:DUF3231 family protein [Bacillota bacterium]